MRPSARLRRAIYAILAVLLASGLAWLALDRMPGTGDGFTPPLANPALPWLLAAHGTAAMAALLLAGALAPLHVRPAWRSGRNQRSGIPTLAAGVLAVVTAPVLYYAGSDALRGWASDLHIAAGIGLVVALLVHRAGCRAR
ncbi:MAG TPA: hypothetical protein VE684_20080 [Crenalkalicoccus sp.]|nr:hypothetical protein [Crenalkalicoccus sp.]